MVSIMQLMCETIHWLASVAQLDACPTGDQEVAGSTPAQVFLED